jgi:iron transport multicopper oxidase
MSGLRSFVGLAVLLAGHANAAIGPVTDLTISNAQVSPDGFTREYVFSDRFSRRITHSMFSAVLAGGVYPGPLITGTKGDNFQINVIDNLTESSMLKSTSIHWHGYAFLLEVKGTI